MIVYIESSNYQREVKKIVREAKSKGYKFCILAASDDKVKPYLAHLYKSSSNIFSVIKLIEETREYDAYELINIEYNLVIQLSDPIHTTQHQVCIEDRNAGYEQIHYGTACDYLLGTKVRNVHISQYDLQRWFNFGHYSGFSYMLVVRNDVAYPDFYPVYVHQPDLSAMIRAYQDVCNCAVVEIYDLNAEFLRQYSHRLFSIMKRPPIIYHEREEHIPYFAPSKELDGLRRRMWDYLRFCQIDHEPGFRSIGAAIELMRYAKAMDKSYAEYIKTMMLKAVPILYPVNIDKTWGKAYLPHLDEHWKLVPLYLILSYYGLTYYDNEINHSCKNPNPGIRNFSLFSRTLLRTPKLLEWANENIYYYCGSGFSTKPLLYSLWLMCDNDDDKLIKFVEDQPWSEDNPGTVSAAVHQFLQSDRKADLYSDYEEIHRVYKRRFYHNDLEYHLSLHQNPAPRLDLPGEMMACTRKAENGDLESILTLAAHYWRNEDWEEGAEKEAYKWIMKGVAFNHPTALYLLGLAYCFGHNVVKEDDHKAFELFKQCADMGYATAYIDLGFCYKNGNGTPEDQKLFQACLIVAERYLMVTADYDAFDEYLDQIYNEDYKAAKEEIDLIAEEYCKKIKTIELEPINYMPLYGQKVLSHSFVRYLIRSEWNS